jgi:phage baseplate assembly protein W
MTDIPHFDLPLHITGSSFTEVEQDTLDDITNCVVAALLTPIGSRKELPDFGTTDLTFQVQPVDVQTLINQVALHEPRVSLFIEQHPDRIHELIAAVKIAVSAREEDESA